MLRIALAFLLGSALATAAFLLKPLLVPTPASTYASPEAVAAAAAVREQLAPHLVDLMTGDIAQRRKLLDQYFFSPRIAAARSQYAVQEKALEIDGVYVEEFTPAEGVPEHNQARVLINLHGGGFSVGARTEGRLESIPVASVAGMRVISVDYRQGPEHRFPAASEDVATVYRHLLQTYAPGQIGIFGCSAGGLLTAQAVAWFDAHDLPRPGAIGIFCAGAGRFGVGDSVIFAQTFGVKPDGADEDEVAYFEGVDWRDPLAAPMQHNELMARFPPTLLISSTRDFALSPALATHQQLKAEGVNAELHVYEGLNHYFFADTNLPESRQVFAVIARFFDRELL